MLTLSVKEEVFGSKDIHHLDVQFQSSCLTLAALIQTKVAAKVSAINAGLDASVPSGNFLSNKERYLNREFMEKRAAKHREEMQALQLDTEKAGYEALSGFQRNAFFVIVDGVQKTDLEEELTLTHASAVHFVRLMPLVGG